MQTTNTSLQYMLTGEQLEKLLRYAHSYGRSQQFNYGLFGPDCKQATHFTEKKAIEYCAEQAKDFLINNP